MEKQLRLAFAGAPTLVKDSAAYKGSKDEVDLGALMLHETAEVLLDLIELTKPVTIRDAEQPQKPERDSGFVKR